MSKQLWHYKHFFWHFSKMGLKIRQKCAILKKLKGILFNHVSASKLYVVFDGMEDILEMAHG